jgi:hypothetical protein
MVDELVESTQTRPSVAKPVGPVTGQRAEHAAGTGEGGTRAASRPASAARSPRWKQNRDRQRDQGCCKRPSRTES